MVHCCWSEQQLEHNGTGICHVHAGMPEELAISKAALARSFDVLALTPKEKTYRCWDTEWPDQSEELWRRALLASGGPAALARSFYVLALTTKGEDV